MTFSLLSAYEHAVLAAGTDFRSDRLWESFIAWETEQQKLANVTTIYDRILGIPTQLYSQHFQKYVIQNKLGSHVAIHAYKIHIPDCNG